MRYCNMINVFKFFIVKLDLNPRKLAGSSNPYPRRKRERGKIVAEEEEEEETGARPVGALRVTGTGRNDMERRSMRRMTGKQKKATISGNLGAVARDPRASSNSRDRLSRLCATVRPATASSSDFPPPLHAKFPPRLSLSLSHSLSFFRKRLDPWMEEVC